MEITGWTIYWITRLDGLNAVLWSCGLVLALPCAVAMLYGILCQSDKDAYKSLYNDEDRRLHRANCATARRLGARGVITGAAVIFAATFIPTTKEAAAILVIPLVANNEDVQGLGEDFVNLAREWMQELRPKDQETR